LAFDLTCDITATTLSLTFTGETKEGSINSYNFKGATKHACPTSQPAPPAPVPVPITSGTTVLINLHPDEMAFYSIQLDGKSKLDIRTSSSLRAIVFIGKSFIPSVSNFTTVFTTSSTPIEMILENTKQNSQMIYMTFFGDSTAVTSVTMTAQVKPIMDPSIMDPYYVAVIVLSLVAVGGFFLVVLVIVTALTWCLCRKRKVKSQESYQNM